MYQRALIIGASGGIGAAVAEAVPAQEVVLASRRVDGLDITQETSIAAWAGGLQGSFDLIFVATGALEIGGQGPEKSFAALEAETMARAYAINAIGPALLFKHLQTHLPREGRSVFACLSARVGSIGDNGLGGWVSYRAAKAALNQVVRTAAIELARSRPEAICAALHPGTVTTDLTQKYLGRHPAVAPSEAASNLLGVINGLAPSDTGGFFDWTGAPVPW